MADPIALDLARRFDTALAALDTEGLFALLDFIILQRTDRGEFLPGSTTGHERYYDRAHIRARQQLGLQVNRVDLRFKPPHMLDAMKGQVVRISEDGIEAEFGYIDGLSNVEAIRLAEFHNITGGSAGDIRRFVGVTDAEAERVRQFIELDFVGRFL